MVLFNLKGLRSIEYDRDNRLIKHVQNFAEAVRRAARGAPHPLLDTLDRNGIAMNEASGPKSLVYAKATYYPDFIRIWIPNEPYLHTQSSKEYDKPKKQSASSSQDLDIYETNEERSIRRTRKALKDYVVCNEFDIFATFTMANDRLNDSKSKKRFSTWLKNQRDRYGKFRYIVVAERHKKDGALHFHALIGGYNGKLVYAINPHTGEMISDGHGGFVRNFVTYTRGHTTAKSINDKESKTKTAYYLQKYINKDMVIIFGQNRYWASKGLKKPSTENNPEPFYKHIEPDRHWMNDHGTVLEFDRDKHPLIDIFLEYRK